jgi:hypothetical protein
MMKKELSKRYGTKHISAFVTKLKNTSVILSIGVILCTATVLATTPQQAFSLTFGPVKNLSNDSDHSREPFVVKSGNKVYVVWSNQDKDIFFKRSTDNGATFGPTKNLSNDPGFSTDARMAASGNSVYVVWEGERSTGGQDIFFIGSTDSGENFGSSINLSNHGSTENPKIAASGNNVYVVWADESFGNFEVAFKRSTNNGASFGSIKNLSNNPPESLSPRVKASGNNVYVIWDDESTLGVSTDVFYKRSTNNGASFESIKNLSGNNNAGGGKIVTSGKNVYVTWQSVVGGGDIFFKRSTNEGASFGSAKNLSNNPGQSEIPKIGASGDNVYVIWMDDTGIPTGDCGTTADNCDVFFRASSNKGASFGGTINLSNNPEASWGTNVLSSGKSVYVLWVDATPGNFDVLFRASDNKGASFDNAINVSDNSGDSGPPDMSRKGNSAYVVWEDVTPGNGEILFKKGH